MIYLFYCLAVARFVAIVVFLLAASGGYPLAVVRRLLTAVASLSCGVLALGCTGFSSVATVGSIACRISWTRDRPCVPCIARLILNHWTTREAWVDFIK